MPREVDDAPWLSRSYRVVGAFSTFIGAIVEALAVISFCKNPDPEGAIVVIAASLMLVIGLLNLATARLILDRKVRGVHLGLTLSGLWMLSGAAIFFVSLKNALPGIILGAMFLVFPCLKIRALLAALPVFADEEDWHREGLPAAKGFEPLFPVQPTVSEREK